MSLKGLLRSSDTSLAGAVLGAGAGPGGGLGLVGGPGSGLPSPALSRRGRELVLLAAAWGPIRSEDCGHVTRSPPITAHLETQQVFARQTVRPVCRAAARPRARHARLAPEGNAARVRAAAAPTERARAEHLLQPRLAGLVTALIIFDYDKNIR